MAFQSVLGICVIIGFAWAISENRKAVKPKVVIVGVLLQFALAGAILNIPVFKQFFMLLNSAVTAIDNATTAGTSFAFGYLGGGPLPFDEKTPGSAFVFAFKGMPMILVISALSSLLFYWKILPVIVRGFAWTLRKTMGVGGATGLCAAADMFVGMVEGPLFIRPYLKEMNRSEFFTIMTCGMSTIAGTVMALYATILSKAIPDAMGHILTASIIHIPAGIMISLLMIPNEGVSTVGELAPANNARSSMDAIVHGTVDGLTMFLHVIAMLVVLVALADLVNQILGLLPHAGGEAITLQRMLGYVMAPVTWLLGVPWEEAYTAGSLMGVKTILNEFIAYVQLSKLPEGALSPHSRLIMVYAMCGFANLGSLGILIGGLSSLAPEKRDVIVSLGIKSILSGTLATCLTGAVVGIVG